MQQTIKCPCPSQGRPRHLWGTLVAIRMKKYFKHRFGYVNVDESNLYLTKTGNWGEVKQLNEKPSRKASKTTTFGTIVGLLIVFVIVFVNVYFINDLIESFGLLISSILIVSYILLIGYLRLRDKYGPTFLIPFDKIRGMDMIDESMLEIKFLDEANRESSQLIRIEENEFKELRKTINGN